MRIVFKTCVVLSILLVFTLAAYSGMGKKQPGSHAIAVLMPTDGNQTKGVVRFTKAKAGVHVTGRVEHLSPGIHGFHIHQFGDCSAANGTSAGGHFNPGKKRHGAPIAKSRHVGDLGNIIANATGVATIDVVDPMLKFDGPGTIIGRGVIVHAGADDLKSQPTGAAGARLACGVVGWAGK